MIGKRGILRGALLLLGLLYLQTANAVTICIATNAEFGAAIETLWNNGTPNGGDLDLRFRPGTYFWPTHPSGGTEMLKIVYSRSPLSTVHHYNFKLSGGWNSGCTVQSLPGGPATILDGSNSREPLSISISPPIGALTEIPTGTVTLDQIHFYRYAGSGATISWNGADVTVRYARISYGTGTAINAARDNTVFLHNSLFEQNLNTPGNSLVYVPSEQNVVVANNTFRGNTLRPHPAEPTIAVGLVKLGEVASSPVPGFATFENNIMRNNTFCPSPGVCAEVVTDSNARVQYNIFSSLVKGFPLFFSDNYNIDPEFAFVIGVVLKPSSLARDIGNNSSMSGIARDYEGGPRVQNMVVDIGAYELTPLLVDTLFADGFE